MLELFRIYGTIELKGADKADKQLDGIDRKAKGATGGIKGFVKGVGKVAAGIGVFSLVSKAIDTVKQSMDGAIARYDTLNNFPRVMQVLGFDAEESDKAINKLSDGIQGLPTRLDEVARHAQNIAVMTGDLDGAVDTTLALNNAFLASGASTADASRGMEVYQNLLATGEVDAQRWKTLQETMGVALSMVAEKAGFEGPDAINKLREAIKNGEISFDEFNDMLIEVNEQQGGLAELAKENTDGLGTAWQNLQTWVVMGLTDVIGAIDEAMGGVGSISGAINKLKPVVMGVFGWIADVAIPAVADSVQWARDRFNELIPVFNQVKGALEPLFAVFRQTGENIKGQLVPFLETLYGVFQSLWPIIEKIGIIIGTSLLVTIIALTSILNGLYNAIIPIVTAFWNLVDVVINVVNAIIAVLTGDFQGALDFWNDAVESSVEFFKNLWDGIVGFVEGFVDAIIGWFETLYNILVGNSIIPDMVNAIVEWFQNLFQWVSDIVMMIVDGITEAFMIIYETVSNYIEMVLEIVTSVWEYIKDTFANALAFIVALVTGDFEGMRDTINAQMENVKNLIFNIWKAIDSFLSKTLGGIWDTVKNIFSNIFSTISSILGNVRSTVTSIWNGIRNTITSVLNGIRSVVSSVWNSIRSVITSVVNGIRSVVTSVFNGIRAIITSVMNTIRSVITSGFNAARSIVSSTTSSIRNSVSSVFNALGGIVSGAMGRVRSAVSNGMSGALRVVTGAAGKFFNAGKNIATSIADGIKGAMGKVTGAMKNVASKIRNFLPFSPAKEGPLSDLDKLDFEGPIGDSIERGESTLKKKMADMLGNVHPTANVNIGGRGVTTASNAQSTSTVAKTQNNEMIQLMKEMIQAIKDGKVIKVNERVLGEVTDAEQGRRVNLRGRVAY